MGGFTVILKPGYGKSYGSEAECLLDWMAGKDFKMVNGPYCSIRDLEYLKADFETLEIYWFNKNHQKYFTVQIWSSLLHQCCPGAVV
jgi:hypothetical protein